MATTERDNFLYITSVKNNANLHINLDKIKDHTINADKNGRFLEINSLNAAYPDRFYDESAIFSMYDNETNLYVSLSFNEVMDILLMKKESQLAYINAKAKTDVLYMAGKAMETLKKEK